MAAAASATPSSPLTCLHSFQSSMPSSSCCSITSLLGCPSSQLQRRRLYSSRPNCSISPLLACPSSHRRHCSSCLNHASLCSTSYRIYSRFSLAPRRRQYCDRLYGSPRSMAPDEEKMTRRSPLDFPIEWERPRPGRRPDIFPQFSPMKTPLPQPPPTDPPEEDEEEEEKKEEEKPEEEPDTPPKET